MKLTTLNSIFDVEYGNKFDLNKMTRAKSLEDAVSFVGRSGRNNGVTAFVQKKNDVQPYFAGLITVALGGAILSSFIQPRQFYTAQNVAVLKPKERMALEEKVYYCLCIQQNRHRYGAFGREANRTLKVLLVPRRNEVPKWVREAFEFVRDDWKKSIDHILSPESWLAV